MNSKTLALAGAVACLAPSAHAVILGNSVWTALPGTTVAARPELACTDVTNMTTAFTISTASGPVTGNVFSDVCRENSSGTLDFYWQVNVDASSVAPLQDLRIGQFYQDSYDADWRIDGTGDTDPTRAFWFGPGSGDVNFNFLHNGVTGGATYLNPGRQSYNIFIHTGATDYDTSAIMDVTDIGQADISNLMSTYAPTSVPEPVSMVALGLAGAAFLRKRARKA